MKKQKFELFPWLAILIFSVFSLPFLKVIPYLDGNIDFVQSYHFFTGGFNKYFANWTSVHPPLKVFLSSLFFKTFGVNPFAYNLPGFLIGIATIFAFYHLAKNLYDSTIAKFASLFLASSALFIATSIFSLRDFLLTCFIIISLYFYSEALYWPYLIFSALAFLAKESGLLLIACVIFTETISFIKSRRPAKFFTALISLGTPLVWWRFLSLNHKKSWSDWLFSENASQGTYKTIVNNIIKLRIFNRYAYQHWLHLFVLNYNWLFWLIILIGSFMAIKKIKKPIKATAFLELNQKQKSKCIIALFCVGYFFTTLCLQTYTIPRYVLPILSFAYLAAAFFLSRTIVAIKAKPFLICVLTIVVLAISLSLVSSGDVLSSKIWGQTEILGQTFYDLPGHLSGNDGITYNLQYLFTAQKRTKEIIKVNSRQDKFKPKQCFWLFPDIRNDQVTLKILNFENINSKSPCD